MRASNNHPSIASRTGSDLELEPLAVTFKVGGRISAN